MVATWPGEDVLPRLPAGRAARGLAVRLGGRGVNALASGRLVRVSLPDAPSETVATAQRAVAAAGGSPAVIALTGPRTDELDALLTLCDAAVLARRTGADDALARVASSRLEPLGLPVSTVHAPGGPARFLASAGVLVSSSFRAALAPALEAAR
jgi:hypothetical protein